MKTTKLILLALLGLLFLFNDVVAQRFIPAFNGYSRKKTSYFYKADGTEMAGTLKSLKYKKGLIESIKMEDESDNKTVIKPEEIVNMYLPPSGFEKFNKSLEFLNDATQWDNTSLNQDIIGKGYAYFESSDVQFKKKKLSLMVQLLNPSFSSKIKVYQDPITGETAGVGVGGVQLTGGLPKSYFVKKAGEDAAFELKKGDYKNQFARLFGDCPGFIKKYGKSPKWNELETHIYEYTQMCTE